MIVSNFTLALLATGLCQELTDSGLEVSDNPNYYVPVEFLHIEETDLYVFMARLPSEVDACSTLSGQATIDHFNVGREDHTLQLVHLAYGKNLKYVGFDDHEHISMAFICRVEGAPVLDEDPLGRPEPHITF